MFELGRAARAGDDARVISLLREGAEVNARNSIRSTALHYACASNHKDIKGVVDVLLEAGADVNAQDMYGRTPLHMAVEESTGEDSAKILFNKSARRNSREVRMGTRFNCVLGTRSCYTQRVLIDALLEAGAQTNIQDEKGQTALHVAIHYFRKDLVKALLAKNTSESCKERSTQHLVDHPQDEEEVCMVNLRDYFGDTALNLVCCIWFSVNEIKDCACLLLQAGASVGVKNNEGMTALHLAVHKRKEIIDFLLNIGEDINATDKNGDTPLHVASEKCQTETVRLLLRKGAKVGVKNARGMTPLHKAVALAAGDIVDILVDFGEYVSAKDHFDKTPLHHLGFKGGMDFSQSRTSKAGIEFTINLLIIRGANIDEKNMDGNTPYECIEMQDGFNCLEAEIVAATLIKQVIRLKTLRLQDEFNISWTLNVPDFYNNVKDRCCQELKDMKSTMVVKDISLYQVLSHINQSFLLSPGDLQHIDKFLSSPDLLARFPLYSDTLRITFQRAKLLTLAVQSFYSETREQMLKKLPLLVVEQLLSLLSNKDLRAFIESE